MGTALYNIFILPIEYFIELIFSIFYEILDNPGLSIVFVSLAVQLLVLPLYKRSDALQEQERNKQKSMEHWIKHIKKTFKGDERFMMQQTYYRQVGYKPYYAVKGSLSLLLQIPFFIAGYNFLSNLSLLSGVSFIGISDLSKPDNLISIGSLTINLLPVLMTVFNIISGIIYTNGFPIKDKIQTYGLACIFLVVLYNSPSGLVFYWTLNNLFSLLKNVFMKIIKHPKRVLSFLSELIAFCLVIYIFALGEHSLYLKIATIVLAVILSFPLLMYILQSKGITFNFDSLIIDSKQVNIIFYLSISVILLLIGLVIPISVVKSSPVEFINVNYGPFGLVFNVFSVAFGLTFVWINIFYSLFSSKIKSIFSLIFSALAITGIINFLFFGKDLGTISTFFVYSTYPVFSIKSIIVNILICIVVVLLIWFLIYKKINFAKRILQITALSLFVLSIVNGFSIEKTLAAEGHPEREKNIEQSQNDKILNLSKNGKNVIVFMLDKAVSEYIPYAFEVKPELKDMFDGFTYYPNTLSFGRCTNYGTPALFGGYEYTPSEMNKRDDETLESKQNEALTVMPKLFSDNGFNVTICDPPYAGYKYTPDLSIYDDYPSFEVYNTIGMYSKDSKIKYSPMYESIQKRNLLYFGIMKFLPIVSQNILYQSGEYWATGEFAQNIMSFLDSYSVLERLCSITSVSDNDEDNFLMLQNSTTHEPILLQEPDYVPSDNITSPESNKNITIEGKVLDLSDKDVLSTFQTNVCALLRIGEWLNYLKENDAYDNTRIIIVSDHGTDINVFESMILNDNLDIECYNALLLVKDFNSTGFKTSSEFMTNADTPSLASNNIIDNPINSFTGNVINNSEKYSHSQIITTSWNYSVTLNNGNTFDTSDGEWWSVSDNIFDVKNWKKVEAK